MKHPSYRSGIRWIAKQDPDEKDVSRIARSNTVKLLAHLYGKDQAQVAEDVVQARIQRRK